MANCEDCKEKKAPLNVPYVVHEAEMARSERHIKRLWIALVVAVVLMFASNVGWLIYESQFETIGYSYDYSQDGEGTNIIGSDNEVNNNGPEAPSKSES